MAFDFLRPFFGNFNPQVIVVGAVFLIFFAFIYFILSKVFKDQYGNPNKAIAGVISLCIAILIVYFGEDFLTNLIYSLNLSDNLLNWVVTGVFIIFAAIIIKKSGVGGFLAVIGSGFIIVGLTELVFRKELSIVIGGILLIIGIWKLLKRKKVPYYNLVNKKATNFGLVILWVLSIIVMGALIGSGIIYLAVMVLAVIILITIFRNRKSIGSGAYSAGKYGAQKIGQGASWAANQTIGKTEIGRNIKAGQLRKLRRKRDMMQRDYNNQKIIYQNASAPYNIRNTAAKEMQRIAQEAVNKGIQLRY